jgi:hypothetical protein
VSPASDPQDGAAGPEPTGADPHVGLCSVCRFARVQRSARGSVFWRCSRAREDPRLVPYPPLPVRRCPAYGAGSPAGHESA